MSNKGTKNGVYVNCETCGKEVYKTITEYKKSKHHYCSYECARKSLYGRSREERECEFCGKKFIAKKSDPKRFCSIGCQHEWQKKNVGSKNPKFEGATVKCDWCGNYFDIGKYNLEKFEHHFCCADCRRKWHANVFSQNPDWKEKSRIRATKILSDKQIDTNTKPQIIINNLLDEMNIEYVNEKSYKYYSVDNYLTESNLIIEVMGDFWHCNPMKYSNYTEQEVHRKRVPRDKAKHTYIKNYYDIDILYLWENDIYYHLDVCKALIENYVIGHGKLENYNSFNYHIEDNILKINSNIIYPYFEEKLA